MSNRISGLAFLAALGLVVATWSAEAAPLVTSEISFDGGAVLNGSLDAATFYVEIHGPSGPGTGGPIVGGASGSFSGALGAVADFTAFQFTPAPLSPFQLWSFTVGPTSYSFDVTSLVVQSQTAEALSIQGAGFAYVTGFDPTPGTFSITSAAGTGSTAIGFEATVSVVPEPAMLSVLLVGSIALAGRRLSR
jgi:hypothetical protein